MVTRSDMMSGVLNTSIWTLLSACLVLLWSLRRRGPGVSHDATRVLRSQSWWYIVVALGLGTVCNTGYGIYTGHVISNDYMQDVLSARSFLDNGTMYPWNITETFSNLVKRTPPPFSIWPEGSPRRLQEAKERERTAALDWVQAHPPLMTLCFVPLVCCFGTYGTYVAVTVISLASLVITLLLIRRTLGVRIGPSDAAAIFLVILGWDAMIRLLRTGQSGVYLGLLLVLGWIYARRGRATVAGLSIGLAGCLKLYPALVLISVFFRRPLAFVVAVTTMLLVTFMIVIMAGKNTGQEYAATTRYVTNRYIPNRTNLSLLGAATRVLNGQDGTRMKAWAVEWGGAVLLVAFLGWKRMRFTRPGTSDTAKFDLEYAVSVASMPLLSPIAWPHNKVVLLLPICLLGHRLYENRARRSSAIAVGYAALLTLIAIPQSTLDILEQVVSRVSPRLAAVTILNVNTAGVLALVGWLAWEMMIDDDSRAIISQVETPINDGDALPT